MDDQESYFKCFSCKGVVKQQIIDGSSVWVCNKCHKNYGDIEYIYLAGERIQTPMVDKGFILVEYSNFESGEIKRIIEFSDDLRAHLDKWGLGKYRPEPK